LLRFVYPQRLQIAVTPNPCIAKFNTVFTTEAGGND
jgi:hypothetical protein